MLIYSLNKFNRIQKKKSSFGVHFANIRKFYVKSFTNLTVPSFPNSRVVLNLQELPPFLVGIFVYRYIKHLSVIMSFVQHFGD